MMKEKTLTWISRTVYICKPEGFLKKTDAPCHDFLDLTKRPELPPDTRIADELAGGTLAGSVGLDALRPVAAGPTCTR
jgi:hypothetical protein